MQSIWVSGASGVLGYGILKALRSSNHKYRLVGTTCFSETAAPLFCDLCIDTIPLTNDPNYSSWVADFIEKYNVVMAIPGLECDSQFWTEVDFPSTFPSTVFLLNNPDLVRLCSDKFLFYQRLFSSKPVYSIPTFTVCNESELPIPFIVKPRNGYGSKGIKYGNSWQEYQNIISTCLSPIIIQPVIGTSSAEFTLSAFYCKESRPLRSLLLRRILSSHGFTEYAEISSFETKKFLEDMGTYFLPIGPTNFQFRLDEGEIKLLEINPRLSSATSMRSLMGYNEADLSVSYFLNNMFPTQDSPVCPTGTRCVRYYEDAILK